MAPDGGAGRRVLPRARCPRGRRDWWPRRGLRHRLAEVHVPVLSWGGWYDNYIGPQLADSRPADRTCTRARRPSTCWSARGTTRAPASTPTAPSACSCRRTAQHRWDALPGVLRPLPDATTTTASAPRATSRCSRSGRNRWRRVPAWPPPDDRRRRRSTCAPGARCRFEAPTADEAPDAYRYDPADPVAETVGGNCWALCHALGDRRRARRPRRHPPLRRRPRSPRTLELTGPGRRPSSTRRRARPTPTSRSTLCDVFADGTVNTIQDGIVRARYRDGLDRPVADRAGRGRRVRRLDLCATSYVRGARPPAARRRLVEQLRPLRPQPEHRRAVRHRIRDDRRPAARSTTTASTRRTSCCRCFGVADVGAASRRPTLYGSRHAVSAGHYLAAAAGFAILEAGGNAIDAGCCAGICAGASCIPTR